jgi:hypothetical protein
MSSRRSNRPARVAAPAEHGPPRAWTIAWLRSAPEGRALAVFVGSLLLLCVAWMITFSLRVPLWDTDDVTIAKPLAMRRIFPGGMSAFTQTVLSLCAITGGYLGCLWAARRGFPRSFPVTIGACAIAGLAVLPGRPLASPDVTHLAADVRTLWVHHNYPTGFGTAPAKYDDPVANKVVVYRTSPSGYGPVAYAIGGLPIPFVGTGLAAHVAGQKFIAGLFLVIAALFAGFAARRTRQNAALAAALIGLNPLFLFEFAGDGHNDSIMVAFAVAASLFVFNDSWRDRGIGSALGVASVLSKFSLVLATPVILASWFPRWRKWVAAGMVALGALAILTVVARYGPRLGTLGPATALSLTTPQPVLEHWLDAGRTYRNWVVLLSYVAFLVFGALIVLRHTLATVQDRIAAAGLLLWLFVFACSPQMLPWYQLWYFPFAVLSGRRWLIVTSLVFTVGAFMPILALSWESDIVRALGIGRPVDVAVVMLWLATGLTALVLWHYDSTNGRVRASVNTRQAIRAQQRRVGSR